MVSKYYTYTKDYTILDNEINFKDGIYRDIILEKIELIKQHIKDEATTIK